MSSRSPARLRRSPAPAAAGAAELFGVAIGTIAKAERQIRPLLDQHGHVIQPAGIQVRTLAELTDLAAAHGVTLIPGTKAAR